MRRLVLCGAVWLVVGTAARSGEASSPAVGAAFWGIVAEELLAAVPRARDRASVRLEGRVVRLDRVHTGRGATVRCEVSLLLLEMPGGSLRAILRGRTEVSGPAKDALEERAVRRAVRRALRPLRSGLPF